MYLFLESNTIISNKKPTKQSTTFIRNGIIYGSNLANDGNTYQESFEISYFQKPTCSSTMMANATNKFHFWQVDLQSKYIITQVKIWNQKSYLEDLKNFQVILSKKENFLDIPYNICCSYGINNQSIIKCQCPPVLARYVTIYKNPGYDYLCLCEVEVYGRLPNG